MKFHYFNTIIILNLFYCRFCPQHDILYDDLTVAEHIDLVASIKGYTKSEIQDEILSISRLVGLDKDLEKKSKQLSGGMKRRLSVAMAVTGGSQIIILDEPTSGLVSGLIFQIYHNCAIFATIYAPFVIFISNIQFIFYGKFLLGSI